MTPFGKLTVHEDGTQHVDQVRRITVSVLESGFGSDRDKRLVVSLVRGDLIEVRPERTHRPETITARELYRILLMRRCQNQHLSKARARKEALARRREAQCIKRAEKRLLK